MSLKDKKIGEYENSIAALPNRVTGRADWLKSQFDARTDKETKESINGIVDELVAASGAQQMGADVPPGVTPTPMPEVGGVSSVQAVLYGLRDYVNEKIVEIGAGDMAMAIYDPDDEVKAAGGITSYVDLALATKANKEWITGTFAAQTGDAGIKYRYNKDLRQLILEGSSTLAGGAWAVGHTIFTLANNPELPRPRGALAITGSIFLIGTGVTSAIRAVVATSGVVSVAGIYGTATQSLDINAVIYLDSNWNI